MTSFRWFRWQMVVVAFVLMVFLSNPVRSQPQTNILITACSLVNVTNLQNFYTNLNETFRNVRQQLANNNTHFATADQTRNSESVYVMGQCRNYMSARDCVACFDFADRTIRVCAGVNGGRAVLDGCFLRSVTHRMVSWFQESKSMLSLKAIHIAMQELRGVKA